VITLIPHLVSTEHMPVGTLLSLTRCRTEVNPKLGDNPDPTLCQHTVYGHMTFTYLMCKRWGTILTPHFVSTEKMLMSTLLSLTRCKRGMNPKLDDNPDPTLCQHKAYGHDLTYLMCEEDNPNPSLC